MSTWQLRPESLFWGGGGEAGGGEDDGKITENKLVILEKREIQFCCYAVWRLPNDRIWDI